MKSNKSQRTRKDLLQAAARLLAQGKKPTLEEVAQEALVSRATAYRYFPSIDALHLEAALDVAAPDPATLFPPDASSDPVERLQRVDLALNDMIRANETALRMMLVNALERIARGDVNKKSPARQNRRTPLILAALEPAKSQFKPAALESLVTALALVIGTEAMLVFKDVLHLSDKEAEKARHWTIQALVEAAKK
jgi:AcrR family transcriptional regulator